jgi:hypothetical protein
MRDGVSKDSEQQPLAARSTESEQEIVEQQVVGEENFKYSAFAHYAAIDIDNINSENKY